MKIMTTLKRKIIGYIAAAAIVIIVCASVFFLALRSNVAVHHEGYSLETIFSDKNVREILWDFVVFGALGGLLFFLWKN